MSGNLLTRVKLRKPKPSSFDLSFTNTLTSKFGTLVPFLVQEVLPGDKYKVGVSHLIRMAPTLAPLMTDVNVFMHYFFVPNRLVWDEWEDFITRGAQGNLAPNKPKISFQLNSSNASSTAYNLVDGSLADYLNYPTIGRSFNPNLGGRYIEFDALPFRAYQLIYNEYYRDQNVMGEVDFSRDSNNVSVITDIAKLMDLRQRSWHHDYFTSALPWPQRNSSGVPVPFSGSAPVHFSRTQTSVKQTSSGSPANGPLSADNGFLYTDDTISSFIQPNSATVNSSEFRIPTITEFRRAFRLQEWMERSAVGGSRYIEQILSHFGVRSSDSRLQRPEYLCGLKNPLVFTEVQQTSASTQDAYDNEIVSPLGVLGGNATSVGKQFSFSRSFEEHGFLIGIMSVMPKASYFQGLPRKYSRDSWDKYYWPEFANIGEQAIENKEIYCNFGYPMGSGVNVQTFGYTPRYAEYRYNPSEIHGEFRNNLDFWHLGRKFDALPNLNSTFLTYDNSNIDRVLAVSSDLSAPLYCQIHNHIQAYRLIPEFSENFM